MDTDRDEFKKHYAREKIQTPDEYRTIIKSASNKNFVVYNMKHHIKNIQEIPDKMHLVNRKKNVLNEQVLFRDGIKWEYGSY